MMIEEVLKINDIVSKKTPRPIITLQTSSGLSCKWLFDTGASITCMSIGAFKSIPIHARPKQIGEGGRNAVGASGPSLVLKGTYLLPLEWNGKKIMQQVNVFQNLNTPLILGIDGIHNLGITYLSMSQTFMFQNEIIGEAKFRKADLMTVQKINIPARTCVPVRLGTAIGRRHTPMAAGLKSVTTVGNPDYPALFSQPGLVVPNHQGDVTLLLQNCGDVDIEIPRCTAIGYIENLQNKSFNEIYAIDEQKLEG